jgi:hypothetical protein
MTSVRRFARRVPVATESGIMTSVERLVVTPKLRKGTKEQAAKLAAPRRPDAPLTRTDDAALQHLVKGWPGGGNRTPWKRSLADRFR